jgi:6-phosphogluconate dehydrogenase
VSLPLHINSRFCTDISSVVSKGALWGIPTPAFSTALSFYDGYRAKDLPANLLQAQRDYFGAHTFRIKPECANEQYKEGQDIHVNWTGRGGNISASVSASWTTRVNRTY